MRCESKCFPRGSRCDRAKYAYALAHEVYRLRNENEAIRAAMREAMRLGGDKVVEAVRK